MGKNKIFGFTIGSSGTTAYVRDQIRAKHFKLSVIEKLLLLALADSPGTFEYLTTEYDLKVEPTEKSLQRLLQKGLIYYPDRNCGYKYAVWVPEVGA